MSIKTAIECVPCFVRQAAEAVEMTALDSAGKERLLRQLICVIAEADWSDVPVVVSRRVQRKIREETGENDVYSGMKKRMNDMALELLPVLTGIMRSQPDQREAVVRLAIAGNLLDAGAKTRLMPEEMSEKLRLVWGTPMSGSADELFQAAEKAENILYLADNAGEIIFDKLLIEALPYKKITVAVRGFPVINDATMEDAEVAGITKLVPVISNGSDAPGTILEECSAEFRKCYENADLIISKGQGNYETVSAVDKNVFFLLTVKCPLVANDVGAAVGTLVVMQKG